MTRERAQREQSYEGRAPRSSAAKGRFCAAAFALLVAASVVMYPSDPAVAGRFAPLVPARLLDTRSGAATVDGAFVGSGIVADSTLTLPVLGRGGVPAFGVGAVAINVTVVEGQTEGGFVTVFPTGEGRPNASSMNFSPGTTVANELLAKVGADGTVSLYVYGRAHLLVDVVGWSASGDRSVPVNRAVVGAGSGVSCAVRSDSKVACWGDGSDGALGNGSNVSESSPVVVSGLTNVVSVAVGGAFACAVIIDGEVFCWGLNFGGQLGTGNYENYNVPQRVAGLPAATAVIAGNGVGACALSVETEVWCWGGFSGGLLPKRLEVGTGPLSGVTQLSAGGGHGCSLTGTGRVYCWGADSTGATGDGPYEGTVRRVPGIDGAIAVAAGGAHSCAVMPQRTVKCWGHNGEGQLGTGATSLPSPQPVDVVGLSGVSRLAAGTGNGHTCAITADTALWCWGAGSSGELGNGATEHSAHPVKVVGFTGATSVSAGYGHTCAMTTAAAVWCWGFNFSGQLGNGTTGQSSVPVGVVGLTPADPVAAASIADAADGFEPLTPARLVDTRSSSTTIDGRYAGEGRRVSGSTLDIAVAGRGGVPSTGVAAVVLNVTAVGGGGAGGFLSVYPTGSPRPNASSLNFSLGSVAANEIVVKVGNDGSVAVFSYQSTDLIIDVVGWVPADGLVHPLNPARLLDTRFGAATIDGQFAGVGHLASGATLTFPVNRGGAPRAGMQAAILNITVVNGQADGGFVTVHPYNSARPNASSLNFRRGQTIANEIVAKVGSADQITLFMYGGGDVIVDIVGWIGTASPELPSTPPPPPPPSNPQQFIAVYVTTLGATPVVGRLQAIAHEIGVMQRWYDSQTGGKHPRFVRSGDLPLVLHIGITATASSLRNMPSQDQEIWRAVASHPSVGGAMPVIYLDGVTAAYCGQTSSYMVYIPTTSCSIEPGADSVWPFGGTYVLAHELAHALGAVPRCAPHVGNGSHIIDDPRDLLYSGTEPRAWSELILDPGHDDYFRHGRADCADIDRSPLLGTD